MTKEEKVIKIISCLSKIYPQPKTALNFSTPLELLIATILSAQTTDKLVNQITPKLFQKYKSAADFAQADFKTFTQEIKQINFHNNKAKNIIAACKIITAKYQGKIPQTMNELDALPGIARKTANVILGDAFHKTEGIAVDTHVIRLSQRLGLTESKDPVKIEQDLMKIVPKNKWTTFSHLLINFGRQYCPARSHICHPCPLGELCPDLLK